MTTIAVEQLEKIQELIAILETHPEVVLVQSNKPVAKITSVTKNPVPDTGRVPNLHPHIWISDDFDAELPEGYWINRTV